VDFGDVYRLLVVVVVEVVVVVASSFCRAASRFFDACSF